MSTEQTEATDEVLALPATAEATANGDAQLVSADAEAARDEAQAQAKPPGPPEYDAHARQRIAATVQTEAGGLPVTLSYEPCAGGGNFDARLREYARRVNAVAATDTADDEAEARALARLDAAAYLFGEVVTDVTGIGAEDEAKPAAWRDYFTPQEKIRIVEDAILSAAPLEETSKPGTRVSWAALAVSTLRLRVLFDGHNLDTRHTLKKADAPCLRDFAGVLEKMQDGANVFFELSAIYGRLKVSARGYKGGLVPVHHQAFAVFVHLNTQLRVTRKN